MTQLATPPRVMHPGATPRTHVRRALRSLRVDARAMLWHLIVNVVGGSPFMPRLGRYVVYRAAGLDVHSPLFYHGTQFTSRRMHFAKNVGVSWRCLFEGGPIHVGENTMIGPHTIITTGNHPFDEHGYASRTNSPVPVTIGADCWLGARVTVLAGVTIADRVSVAAGAVVVSDLLVPGVYAGVPARLIRAFE